MWVRLFLLTNNNFSLKDFVDLSAAAFKFVLLCVCACQQIWKEKKNKELVVPTFIVYRTAPATLGLLIRTLVKQKYF